MVLVLRETMDLRPPRSSPVPTTQNSVTFHWNGPSMLNPNHSSCLPAIRSIQSFHMDARGWNDIAYNFLVCEHGIVFEGRGSDIRNAANGTSTGNRESHGVMVMCGSGNPLTAGHRNGIIDIAHYLGGNLYVHSDWVATQCPGQEISQFVRAGFPPVGPPTPPPYPGGYYRRGHRGETVMLIQQRLMELGYDLGQYGADGDFGIMTDRAVRSFQDGAGISSDGIVGPITWGHLFG